jgi:DNA primase
MVGFTSRGIFSWSSDIKYKTPPGFPIARYLYGEDLLAERMETIVIVEGPFDQLRVGVNSVATFGKKLSTHQLSVLLKLNPKTLTLMWDSDAHMDAGKYGALLSNYFPTRVVLLDEGDPGSLSRRKLLAAIEQTPYYRSFEWSLTKLENRET